MQHGDAVVAAGGFLEQRHARLAVAFGPGRGRREQPQQCQLQPHPPPAVPLPPIAPSRLVRMCCSAASACGSESKRMIRSARYSRSLGLTAHFCAEQPESAASAATILKNDRKATGILL